MTQHHFRSSLALAVVAAATSAFTLVAVAKDDTMSNTGTRYKARAESLDPAEARKLPMPSDAVMAVLQQQGKPTDPTKLVPGVTRKDSTIAGPAGSLPVRIYTPDGKGPFPVVVYYHGGGWVIASKEVYDGGARGLAEQAQAIVVSVDYRLAPEAKFPAQHDDALATYKWAAQTAARIRA